jgi:hypothetical protein
VTPPGQKKSAVAVNRHGAWSQSTYLAVQAEPSPLDAVQQAFFSPEHSFFSASQAAFSLQHSFFSEAHASPSFFSQQAFFSAQHSFFSASHAALSLQHSFFS